MKRIFFLIFPTLFLFSCKKESGTPSSETITKGSKWGLEIGSSPADVYSQLQALGGEKGFSQVAVVYRQPFSNPQQIQNQLGFYQSVTLENNTAIIDRVLIEFPKDKVSTISSGGALPTEISKWPPDAPDEMAIHENDPASEIYTKLLAIYQFPAYGEPIPSGWFLKMTNWIRSRLNILRAPFTINVGSGTKTLNLNPMLLSMAPIFPSISGWTGTVSYLSAYLLLSMNRLKADQKLYHALNIVGAVGLTYNAVSLCDFPNIIVNVVWGIIACWAIFSIARKRQNSDG